MLPLPRLPAVAALDSALFIGTNWVDLTDGGATTLHKHDHGGMDGLADDDHAGYPWTLGRAGGLTLIGGTGVTDDFILRTTSGVGTTGSDMIFQVGNNGAVEAMRILDTGFIGLNWTAPHAKLSLGNDVSGKKLLIYDNATGLVQYGFGIASSEFRMFCAAAGHISFGNMSAADGTTFTETARFDGNTGAFTISSSGGFGYSTGSGGTVSQATSKSTGVSLSKTNGTITMHNADLAAGAIVTFIVTNNKVAATDVICIQHDSGGTLGAYTVSPNTPAAGTFQVSVRNNTSGTLGEAIVLRYVVIKASVA